MKAAALVAFLWAGSVLAQTSSAFAPQTVLRLDQRAVLAERKWRFEPALRNGERVAVPATIEVPFHLQNTGAPVRV